MKKILILSLSFALCLSLVACSTKEKNPEPSLTPQATPTPTSTATPIEEITSETLLVEDEELKLDFPMTYGEIKEMSEDKIIVNTVTLGDVVFSAGKGKGSPEVKVGDKVLVAHDKIMTLSLPPQCEYISMEKTDKEYLYMEGTIVKVNDDNTILVNVNKEDNKTEEVIFTLPVTTKKLEKDTSISILTESIFTKSSPPKSNAIYINILN